MVPAGVVMQYDCVNDPDGHLHTSMQRHILCLPFPLSLRKSSSSSGKADKLLHLKAKCLEREELCNHHNSLLQCDYCLRRTKVPSYSDCPLCQTKAPSHCAQKMHSTMVAPWRVYKMCGTKVSCAVQELWEIFICALALKCFCREKFPCWKASPQILAIGLTLGLLLKVTAHL